MPVYAIPDNHDHGGAGSLWTEAFFKRESASLAPNLKILLEECPLTTDEAIPTDRPGVVVAHGSVQDFGPAAIDYVALGDWHGTKEVGRTAWYSGTPELDRFVRGDDPNLGNVLVVTAERGAHPLVEIIRTSEIGCHDMAFDFLAGRSPDRL